MRADARTLLQQALASDPGRPLLTMYDDASGERVELSVATFDNWVSKTANYLLDELMLEAGEPVGIDLPPHWLVAVIEVAVLCAGATVVREPARITFWLEGSELPDEPVVEEVVGLSLRPMALGLAAAPAGVADYTVDVRGHGDHFSPRYPAAQVDVQPLAGRVLTDRLDALLPALAGGGSLVLCRHPEPSALAHRAETERATAAQGLEVEGLPAL